MKIVISQPMYFPWIGLFEQIKLADLYVHYDDVQFSKGSFTNRVQLKTNSSAGFSWLTVPLKKFKLGTNINGIEIDNRTNWQCHQLNLLKQEYQKAPYQQDAIDLLEEVFDMRPERLVDVSTKSIELVIDYFGMLAEKKIHNSSKLNIQGKSSTRVYNIVNSLKGTTYITGHGARKYLDHNLFDSNNIRVEYMNYLKIAYPQQYSDFNPYVSVLDLIANVGKAGAEYMSSPTIYWKDFLSAFDL